MNSPASAARFVRDRMPPGGLFAGQTWRTAVAPLVLPSGLRDELDQLGRILWQFQRAVNLLYRQSVEGRQPEWIAAVLDRGKPAALTALQQAPPFRNQMPRVLRPDILLTDDGWVITELDAVPGGIGVTQWLNESYAALGFPVAGGDSGMRDGFASLFGDAPRVHIVVSEESAAYRPEMEWLAGRIDPDRFAVRTTAFQDFAKGDAVYRFFELFDLPVIASATRLLERAAHREILLTPPPRPLFEEKLLLSLLWNRNLRAFWQQEMGTRFFERLLRHVPRTWLLDPAPLPPQGAYPDLNLTDWRQLGALSQKERDLIVKVSGFSNLAWGARGVALGSDLSAPDWAGAVAQALESWPTHPHILQRYHKPRLVGMTWQDFDRDATVPMSGRVRLCPYYFVAAGDPEAARPVLGGVLATVCPADKKIIHGMADAILAPVLFGESEGVADEARALTAG